MDVTFDLTSLQPILELDANSTEPFLDNSHELTATEGLIVCEQELSQDEEFLSDSNQGLATEVWKPAEAQYCKAIADYYKVERRTVQKWFVRLQKLCPWFVEADLKLPDDRYTPLAVELMGECYLSGSTKQWAQQMAERYAASTVMVFDASLKPMQSGDEVLPQETPNEEEQHGNIIPYQATSGEMERFTPPTRKIFKYTSTQSFVQDATQQTEEGLETTQSNSSALTDALINQMTEEGRKLGVTLFQAKYGTAHAVLADLEEALAKKSGLVSDSASPPSGSAA